MIIYKFFALGEYEKEEEWRNNMGSMSYALKTFKFITNVGVKNVLLLHFHGTHNHIHNQYVHGHHHGDDLHDIKLFLCKTFLTPPYFILNSLFIIFIVSLIKSDNGFPSIPTLPGRHSPNF